MRKVILLLLILGAGLLGQELVPELVDPELLEPEELVLPSWTEEDLKALASGELVPGSSLLGDIAMSFLNSDNDDPIEIDPVVRDLPEEEPEEEWSTRIEPQFLTAYFHEMPTGFLNDPQHLLTTQEFRDREGFLNYHARDTDINLYVYLFDALQEIPPAESIGSVVRSHIDQDKPVAVVFYFLGMPEKSQLAFSEKVTESVSQNEREKVLRMAVEEALEKSDPSSQLESFSIQLSIRLYWLERVVARERRGVSSARPFILPETRVIPAEKINFWNQLRAKPVWFYSFIILSVVFLAILLGLIGRWVSNRRRIYVFPDAVGNLLLEAPHAPGVGGVISFSSVKEPPSSQKADVPDYLEKM